MNVLMTDRGLAGHHTGRTAQTRDLYKSMGFIPLEEHQRLDWSGPTLVLVEALR